MDRLVATGFLKLRQKTSFILQSLFCSLKEIMVWYKKESVFLFSWFNGLKMDCSELGTKGILEDFYSYAFKLCTIKVYKVSFHTTTTINNSK